MSIFKDVRFNDGEGISHVDLNNAQGFLRSQLWDTWGELARICNTGNDVGAIKASASYADEYATFNPLFALGAGGAPVAYYTSYYSSSTQKKVGNLRGVIAQKKTLATNPNVTGDAPDFVSYYATEDEFVTTIADNASGNPRWDIGVVKLDVVAGGSETRHFEDGVTRIKTTQSLNKRGDVVATFAYIQGTPAAVPVLPTIPAGYSVLWSVVVPSGFTQLENSYLRDHRVPVGVQAFGAQATVYPDAYYVGQIDISAHAAGTLYKLTPLGARATQRLLYVELTCFDGLNNTSAVMRIKPGNGAAGIVTITPPPAAGVWTLGANLASDETTIWGNGSLAGPSHALNGGLKSVQPQDEHAHLEIELLTTVPFVTRIGAARFIFAGAF